MCIVCQTISIGAAALTGILPVAVPGPEALKPLPAATSSGVAQAASIGGTACKKIGQIRKTSAGSFRCTAVGKQKSWKSVKPATTKSTKSKNAKNVVGVKCSKIGEKQVRAAGYLECRKVSGGRLQWFALSNSPSAPAQAAGSSEKSLCKLSDQRTVKSPAEFSVGFPMNTENIPASGPIKIAFIPIDFADVPGSYAPLSKAQADMDILSRWVSVMSGGRSSVDWVVHNSWLRASKTSNLYSKTVEGAIAQEAFNLADPFIDFSGVHTAMV